MPIALAGGPPRIVAHSHAAEAVHTKQKSVMAARESVENTTTHLIKRAAGGLTAVMATFRQLPRSFRIAEQPGTTPFVDTSAFVVTALTASQLPGYPLTDCSSRNRRGVRPPKGSSGHVCDFCLVAPCLSADTSRLKQRSQVQHQE